MMYKKTYRRKTFKKYPKYKRYNKYRKGNTAVKALKKANYALSQINAEVKYMEQNVTPVTQNSGGGIFDGFCLPPQGVGASNREGDSIKVKNLTFRGMCKRVSSDELIRIIIFWDKQNIITSPADYLEQTGTSNAVFSDKAENNRFNTKTLKDVTFTLTSDRPIAKIDWVIKVDQHVHFDIGTVTASTGILKMITICQDDATLQFYSRCTYIDN